MRVIELKDVWVRFTHHYERNLTLRETMISTILGKRKQRRGFWALSGINFSVKKGETLGIIGKNAAGKTSLLRLIAGILKPDTGEIVTSGKVSNFLQLGAGFHPDLTGRENIYLNASLFGLSKKDIERKFKDIVEFSELEKFIDTPIKYYSAGMYARLGFSIAIHMNPDILLIDEVLAVGDGAFQEKCYKKMGELKKEQKTIVLVSHDIDMVKRFCNRVLFLDRGEIMEDGDPEQVVSVYLELLSAKAEEGEEAKGAVSTVKKPKVFVVGLDGATFDLIQPWVKRGNLKNFAKILRGGCYCNLRSSLPPVTAPAWASFLTGKNPGKHGVFDFNEYHPLSYDGPIVNSRSIHSETILELIGKNGGKVGAVNIPLTYPTVPVNGFVVSGLPAPTSSEDFTYPRDLIQEIKSMGINYKLDLDWLHYRNRKKGKDFLHELAILDEQRKKVTLELMNRYDWDLFVAVFTGIDQVQHYFWRYMDKTHPNYDSREAKIYKNAILDFYKEMDAILGEIMRRMDEETILMVVSDHGAGPLKKKVNFHLWLVENGLMGSKAKLIKEAYYDFIRRLPEATVNSSRPNSVAARQVCIARDGRDVIFAHPPSDIKYRLSLPQSCSLNFALTLDPRVWSPEKGEGVLFEISLTMKSGENEKIFSRYIDPKHNPEDRRWHDYELDLSRFGGKEVCISFSTRPGDTNNTSFCWASWAEPRICDTLLSRVERTYGVIDWSNTKLFFGSNHNIFVNLRGRWENGLVEPGQEYEHVIKDAIKRLNSLKDPETGERIIQQIHLKEKIYSGKYFNLAPDLVIVTHDNTYQGKFPQDQTCGIVEPLVPEEDWGGLCASHRMNGIFIAYGYNIKNGGKLSDKEIVDAAPTICYALGLPIPKGIDGKVITDIFEESFLGRNEMVLEDNAGGEADNSGQTDIFSDEETAKIKEKLRGLGYIS